jgi:hypothetical protein
MTLCWALRPGRFALRPVGASRRIDRGLVLSLRRGQRGATTKSERVTIMLPWDDCTTVRTGGGKIPGEGLIP